jgi:hypothetical protein
VRIARWDARVKLALERAIWRGDLFHLVDGAILAGVRAIVSANHAYVFGQDVVGFELQRVEPVSYGPAM